MTDEKTLRQRAREGMQSGKLPGRRPERMWGGRGSGGECAICGHPLTPDQFEFELQFSANGAGSGADGCHVHIRCFAAWEFERENSETAGGGGKALRAASDGDTIAPRERDSPYRRGSV
jgi:hypothetical protein